MSTDLFSLNSKSLPTAPIKVLENSFIYKNHTFLAHWIHFNKLSTEQNLSLETFDLFFQPFFEVDSSFTLTSDQTTQPCTSQLQGHYYQLFTFVNQLLLAFKQDIAHLGPLELADEQYLTFQMPKSQQLLDVISTNPILLKNVFLAFYIQLLAYSQAPYYDFFATNPLDKPKTFNAFLDYLDDFHLLNTQSTKTLPHTANITIFHHRQMDWIFSQTLDFTFGYPIHYAIKWFLQHNHTQLTKLFDKTNQLSDYSQNRCIAFDIPLEPLPDLNYSRLLNLHAIKNVLNDPQEFYLEYSIPVHPKQTNQHALFFIQFFQQLNPIAYIYQELCDYNADNNKTYFTKKQILSELFAQIFPNNLIPKSHFIDYANLIESLADKSIHDIEYHTKELLIDEIAYYSKHSFANLTQWHQSLYEPFFKKYSDKISLNHFLTISKPVVAHLSTNTSTQLQWLNTDCNAIMQSIKKHVLSDKQPTFIKLITDITPFVNELKNFQQTFFHEIRLLQDPAVIHHFDLHLLNPDNFSHYDFNHCEAKAYYKYLEQKISTLFDKLPIFLKKMHKHFKHNPPPSPHILLDYLFQFKQIELFFVLKNDLKQDALYFIWTQLLATKHFFSAAVLSLFINHDTLHTPCSFKEDCEQWAEPVINLLIKHSSFEYVINNHTKYPLILASYHESFEDYFSYLNLPPLPLSYMQEQIAQHQQFQSLSHYIQRAQALLNQQILLQAIDTEYVPDNLHKPSL